MVQIIHTVTVKELMYNSHTLKKPGYGVKKAVKNKKIN